MSRADDVLTLLADVGLPLDDDDIGDRLRINRHYVNAVCRQLADAGLIRRERGRDGKLVNLIEPSKPVGELSGVPAVAVSRSKRPITHRGDRARRNVDALIAGFTRFVDVFETSEAFPGPSLYFHERALAHRRLHAEVESLIADEQFFEYVYAVLPAWGMHRMGNQSAKVGPFDVMVDSFRSCRPLLESLWSRRITDVDVADVDSVAGEVWEVISELRVSTSATRVVAGSKALHHALPDLVPPIDREYTFRFFTGQKSVSGAERRAFLEWFSYFCQIGRTCASEIEAVVERGGFMATGATKVIDNAIMGFIQSRRSASGEAEADAAG